MTTQDWNDIMGVLTQGLTYAVPIAIFWGLATRIAAVLINWITGGNKSV